MYKLRPKSYLHFVDMKLNPIIISGQKATENYYGRNFEPWDNAMFVCFGYDVETPSNSHLYTVSKAKPKVRKHKIRRKSDTSTSDEEVDLQNCRSTTNGEPSIDIFSGTDHDPLDPHEQDHERQCDELYGGGDPCEDAEAMYIEAGDLCDLYDPCAYEETYGTGADVYGGHDDDHDDNELGVSQPEGFCPWETHHGHDTEHDDDYDHFYSGVDEEQDNEMGEMGDFGGDFGGMGGEEGGDDFGGGGDYGGGDYGGGGCATGDDFGGDDFGGGCGTFDDFGDGGGGGYDDDDD